MARRAATAAAAEVVGLLVLLALVVLVLGGDGPEAVATEASETDTVVPGEW
jgi:hypothetical protein